MLLIECLQKEPIPVDDEPQADKISDVARPGITAANPTSKPIITGHGPMAADPFLQPKTAELLPTSDKPHLSVNHQKVLSPSEGFDPESQEHPSVVPKPSTDQPNLDQSKATSTEEERAKQEHLAKLVADKTYFLPVGSVAKRKGSLIALIVLGVVAIGAAMIFYLMNK